MTSTSRAHLTATLTPEQESYFQAWRADALAKMPYFSRYLFSMRVINAPGLSTFAVDAGHRLYIDFDTEIPRGSAYCSEALLHESMHLFGKDAMFAADLGIDGSDRQMADDWNAATDAAHNDDLQDAGCTHVPDPAVHILPESLGCERNQTPHHYFAHIRDLRQQAARNQPLTITLRPARIAEGKVKGTSVRVTARPGFADPANVSLTVTDPDGTAAPVTTTRTGSHTLMFTIGTELPVGSYTVTATSGGKSAEATLTVATPTIRVKPDHIESGWVAPFGVAVVGDLTAFTSRTTVAMTHAEAGASVPVSGVTRVSATDLRFDIAAQAPKGVYEVAVTEAGQTCVAVLPIEMPYMEVAPNHLPVGYAAPQTLAATVTDFVFDAATTIQVALVAPGQVQVAPSNYASIAVTSPTTADITLHVSLPEGQYLATAMNSSGVQAVGTFVVGNGGGGSEDGEGEGTGGEPDYKGCGSGAGGNPAPCELDPDDDLGGTAPAASSIEKENARIATAAQIRDHAAKHPGSVPGNLVSLAEEILAPTKTPWERILGGFIRRSVAAKQGHHDIDRNRRSRRRHNVELCDTDGTPRGRIIYPGYYEPTPSVHFVRDTSGSMDDDDLAAVGREIMGVSKRLSIKGKDLLVTDCDTRVHPPVPFKNAASIKEVKGRGGTDMVAGINSVIEAKGKPPTCIVVATDGYTGWPTERTRVPVIACLVPQRDQDSVPQHVIDAVPDWIRVVVVEPGDTKGKRTA